mmetsp:Transcript_7538/g.6673  ORF Transcript_7538/g.6673 Transcript_7538/m.6673 type:complete len:252 (+) Transcript_7538:208-963(+)
MIDRKERIDEIRGFKEMNRSMMSLFSQQNKTHLSLKVRKANEIKNIMKREQSQEKDRNLKMLTYLNKKEKQRNFIIKTQLKQEKKNKNIILKMRVNRSAHNNRARRKDKAFVTNFVQSKNIIEKQMFRGMMIKEKRNIRSQNRIKRDNIKQSRVFINHQAIPNKVFDTSVSHPKMFNSLMESEKEFQNSTMYNEKDYETNGRTSTVYGQSFNEFPQYEKNEKSNDNKTKSHQSFRFKKSLPKYQALNKRIS